MGIMGRIPGFEMLLTMVVIAIISMYRLAYATKNFCGTTWDDASLNCDNRQPCELGTDEECTSGTYI